MALKTIFKMKIPLGVILGLTLSIGGFIVFCAWVALNNAREDRTRRQLYRFSNLVRTYAVKYEILPGPTLEDAIQAMINDADFGTTLSTSCGMLLRNRDAWNRHFIYEQNRDRLMITVRSCGRNGKDDVGMEDDIEVRISLFGLLKKGVVLNKNSGSYPKSVPAGGRGKRQCD